MYAAVILGFTALLIDSFTWIRFTIYILEIIVLLKKISFEETALAEKFPAYAAYKSRTRRLIPFFY
jgi:protein-S-isoprenylcysteine O-methyltransferase Ste14